jgi:PKD repeat protein
MRTTSYTSLLLAAAGMTLLAACTVKDIDAPLLTGPSTFATSIIMTADRDTLLQNGVDFTDIRIVALGPNGQSQSVPLRAQIYVNGSPADFGSLSTKTPITPTTIRYTAPPASALSTVQTAETVTITVTPMNAGDFRGEVLRQLDINLQPVGIILPVNASLAPAFTFTPAAPTVGDTVAFDASTSTNNGSACLTQCSYAWDFGDGTTAIGLTTTHVFRKSGIFPVKLTVTDSHGASASRTISITVAPGPPPTASFTVSPTPPPTNVDINFNASASRPAAGRTIVSYSWEFGDGTGASGPIVTHKYTGAGTFVVMLTVTDDAGTATQVTQNLNVGTTASEPTASMTTTVTGRTVTVNASASRPGTGATIVNYKFDYGDGNFENVPNPVQSHTYTGPGTFIVLLEVTDSNGKKASVTASVTIP